MRLVKFIALSCVILFLSARFIQAIEYYVDPAYNGSIKDGSAAHPWKTLGSGQWTIINNNLLTQSVTVYFSACAAGSDTHEDYGTYLQIYRTANTSYRLVLDGISKYNTDDANPSWAVNTSGKRLFVHGDFGVFASSPKKNYVTIRGFECMWTKWKGIGYWGGDHVIIEDCVVYGDPINTPTDGPGIYFDYAYKEDNPSQGNFGCTDIIIRNNLIHDTQGEPIYFGGNGNNGPMSSHHSNVLIEGNTVYNAALYGGEGDGIDVKDEVTNLTIRGNVSYNNPGSGITTCSPAIIENNLCYGNEIGIAFGNFWGSGVDGTVCRNNITYNNRNVGYNSGNAGIKPGGGIDFHVNDVSIYNNTCYDETRGIIMSLVDNSDVSNNIIYNCSIYGIDNQHTISCVYYNNNVYGSASGNYKDMIDPTGSNGNISQDPLFINAPSKNFKLQPGSPCINNGKTLAGVTNDFDRNTRPNGSGYEIGAYEYIFSTDATPPEDVVQVRDGDSGADMSSATVLTRLSANWDASTDSETGISKYYYAIGTFPGVSDISAWTDVGLSTYVTKTGLSLSIGTTYYFSVKAENGWGLQSSTTVSNGQVVVLPLGYVYFEDGFETGNLSKWNGQSSETGCSVAADNTVTEAGSYALKANDTSVANGRTYAYRNIDLNAFYARFYFYLPSGYLSVNDEKMFISAINGSNNEVQFDLRNTAGSLFRVHSTVDWTNSDSTTTPVEQNWYSVEIYFPPASAGSEVKWWLDGIEQPSFVTNLAGNGNWSQVRFGFADKGGNTSILSVYLDEMVLANDYIGPIIVDASPPSNSVAVRDGLTTADISFTTVTAQLSANWDASTDSESGILEYLYAIGTFQGGFNTTGWTANGVNTSVIKNVALSVGTTYYFSVKARNGAGLFNTAVNSNGQCVYAVQSSTVDATPPSNISTVRDGANLSADLSFTTDTTKLSANWTGSTDMESGIKRYWYGIGSVQGSWDIVNWSSTTFTAISRTGLSLSAGTTYYFSVKAENYYGLQSAAAYSNGQYVLGVATPSIIANIRDGVGPDLCYTYATDELSANWDSVSDSAGYLYAIGVTSGTADFVSWTDVGESTYVTRRSLGLTLGTTYYFAVKGINVLGTLGPANCSNGQYIKNISEITAGEDITPPSAINEVRDGLVVDIDSVTANTSELSANWGPGSSDPESGVKRYWYAIGTSPGATDTVSWSDNGLASQVICYGLTLVEGTSYFFSVKAENWALLENNWTSSDGVICDTGLLTPVVLTGPVLFGPNPLRTGHGNMLIFKNIRQESMIGIYTISGKLVCVNVSDASDEICWDGKNAEGKYVAQGIYIYRIKDSEGNTKTGKIAVKKGF
ncbi:MAG: hypothetical protein A3J83_08740 [Elusimicrobia bacterium RIFOXYA2_FULL_40_6]|nr:MAG: hypothetical protein A3J83_08740 [Elusimicrobia bacterium RIFOXYA2_FULL_40_6]